MADEAFRYTVETEWESIAPCTPKTVPKHLFVFVLDTIKMTVRNTDSKRTACPAERAQYGKVSLVPRPPLAAFFTAVEKRTGQGCKKSCDGGGGGGTRLRKGYTVEVVFQEAIEC